MDRSSQRSGFKSSLMQFLFVVLLVFSVASVEIRPKLKSIIQQIPDIRTKSQEILDGVSQRYIPQNYEPQNIQLEYSSSKSIKSSKFATIFPFAAELAIGSFLSAILMDTMPLSVMFGSECLFLLYIITITELFFNKPKQMDAYSGDREWEFIWKEALRSVSSNPRDWFRSWFLDENISFEDITFEDAFDFLTWAMYLTKPDQLTPEQSLQVLNSLQLIERSTDWSFPHRLDRKPLESMKSTIEPIKWIHKPAAFYMVTQGLFGKGFEAVMKNSGFEEVERTGFKYWIRKSISAPLSPPIVFFHGVGGLPAYIKLIQGFGEERNIVVLEMPYVSLHVEPNVPTIQDHIDWYKSMLSENNWQKGTIIGHSWGTNVCSWIIQSVPNQIQSIILLDPVCLMLHLNTITKGWFYDGDKSTKPNESILSSVVGLVKTELFTVNTLQRRLVWSRNILFPSEIQAAKVSTAVIVSTIDKIVPSSEVVRQINEHNRDFGADSDIRIYELEGSEHGGCVFETGFRDIVLDIIKKELKREIL